MNLGVFRLFGRRMRVQGRPLLLLTTIGAKTGRRRQATLGWFPDDEHPTDSWIIVAAKAGAATHPAWYINLARRPHDASVEVGGRRFSVDAYSLHGPERERAWARIAGLAPGYGRYAEQTDREIPVVRLTPRR